MFHVGGARSAPYAWAVARQSGDTFVLRVEDTDTAVTGRSGHRAIIDALAATGISAADPGLRVPVFPVGQCHPAPENGPAAVPGRPGVRLRLHLRAAQERTGSEHLGV
ncbi:glutamate--tRNA ligase family protein [Nonomuraea sp. NPDC051941]|uniref:glutamate--tRNA ligase family protein n=1 Tax=Nonomuraea sp. NPDC051941 TaxID=3364373 RepID=UPI0037C59A60